MSDDNNFAKTDTNKKLIVQSIKRLLKVRKSKNSPKINKFGVSEYCKKICLSSECLLPTLEAQSRSPNMLGRGKSKGLE
jgi:hypothetical protein